MRNLLDRLTAPCCVAPSGPLEKIKLNLTVTKLIGNFGENLFSSYEINSWKPEPDIFSYAAKCMGFIPSECVVVEDSIAGVEAANAGGFDVYAYVEDELQNVFAHRDVKTFPNMNMLDSLL